MKVWNLIEDTEVGNGCFYEHGLSFYLETEKHRLLVDVGASGRFLHNAQILGIDLEDVDLVFLSHGHYDHSGGLMEFAKLNPKAPVYVRDNIFEEYFHKKEDEFRYIGVGKEIRGLSQLVYVEKDMEIDSELSVFTNVLGRKYWPEGNRNLKVLKEEIIVQDDFSHEQYLVVKSEGKEILLSGCAHNGILNILDRYIELNGHEPDAVFSGLHMKKQNGYTEEEKATIRDIAYELKKYKTRFYTGHCTGREPYELMKAIMGGQIEYLRSGDVVEL
ncbi:MAG: MBL fold metallo-hydrolase [Dorea sp.]